MQLTRSQDTRIPILSLFFHPFISWLFCSYACRDHHASNSMLITLKNNVTIGFTSHHVAALVPWLRNLHVTFKASWRPYSHPRCCHRLLGHVAQSFRCWNCPDERVNDHQSQTSWCVGSCRKSTWVTLLPFSRGRWQGLGAPLAEEKGGRRQVAFAQQSTGRSDFHCFSGLEMLIYNLTFHWWDICQCLIAGWKRCHCFLEQRCVLEYACGTLFDSHFWNGRRSLTQRLNTACFCVATTSFAGWFQGA